MKPLIEVTSSLYHKRMAREINRALEHSVYYRWADASTIKVLGAKTIAGQLHVKVWFALEKNPVWMVVIGENINQFTDGFGRQICASRTAPRGRQ